MLCILKQHFNNFMFELLFELLPNLISGRPGYGFRVVDT
jgi:hypothetical protein